MNRAGSRVLEGKAVIVTGAGQGIGAAIAHHAAELGARVVVNDIDEDLTDAVAAEIREAGGEAVTAPADVAQWSTGEALVAACLGAFGTIDGLVNNAGVFRTGTFLEMREEDVAATVRVNLMGTAACAQAAARAMMERGTGSIVNIVSGAVSGIPGLGAYGASKGAVASLTYAWALELRGTGVRLNAVSPRAETRMAAMTTAYRTATYGSAAASAAGPFPQPAQNAPVVCFLLSDLSAHVHGQVVRTDGELLALMTHPAVLEPKLCHQRWTVEEIARAFADEFEGMQQQSNQALPP
jgi:NAD(P)-dependent dehydrogenase (short-subunit alcohol dehydrogenase family)